MLAGVAFDDGGDDDEDDGKGGGDVAAESLPVPFGVEEVVCPCSAASFSAARSF